jgi:hypothetical protein
MNPTQQGADAERAAFEAWYRSEFPGREVRTKNLIGTYTHSHIDWCFTGWEARAAASVPAQQAPAPITSASVAAQVGVEPAVKLMMVSGLPDWSKSFIDGFKLNQNGMNYLYPAPASRAVSGEAVRNCLISSEANWSDAEIIAVLASCGVDIYPSKYGFDATQVSATSIPTLRAVLQILATNAPTHASTDAAPSQQLVTKNPESNQ